MSLTNPNALLLLFLLPLFIYIGRPQNRLYRRRDILALLIRLGLVTLLVLTLAGIQIPRDSDQLGVVFLVDVSDSMDQASKEAALDYVRSAIQEMNLTRDQAAVVLFGADAVVEQPMAAALDLSQIGANPITLNTDLSEAVRLGLALFPPETAKRMVILSDGVETVGDAESAARLAAATNVQIDYVPFAREVITGEILVEDVTVPPRVNESELFDVVVNVASQEQTQAELRVLAGGEIIHQEMVELQVGENRYSVGPFNLPITGFVDFRVQVEPLGADQFYQNNELAAFTEVRGRPSVLLVTPNEQEIEYLRPALEESGLLVNVMNPRDLPTGLAELSAYNSIVLVNTPATDITPDRMELLQIFVRDLGGGLVAVGGPDSYGVGGYFETPLEETLPVDMRIRDQQRIPSLTMLFIIDRSGSMEMATNALGVSNLEIAKEAIMRSFNLLNDYDRVGVISFDSESYSVLPIQDVGDAINRQQMAAVVGALRPGGGTDIFGGMATASDILPSDPSALKHIILLTDGGSNPTGVLELGNSLLTNYGITTSVVAVGQGYSPWISGLAQAGGGNFHEAFDASTIPSIFSAETVLATRSYIMEQEFVPTLTARSPIMEGITETPSLQGYVATTEKDTATVILRAPEEDPLLASWQYGLGRAVAFTSDASARWSSHWVSWDSFSRFWSQTIRWTITEGTDTAIETHVEQRGEQAYLVIDARDEDGEFLNGLSLNSVLVNPGLQSQTLPIPQVAPGRYEVAFTPETEGAYFVRIAGSAPDQEVAIAQTAGWVLSYSREYRLAESDRRFLNNLSDITGGVSLENNPAGAFDHNLTIESATQPIWQYLVALAAFLLVIDIAVRRLVINRTDLEKLREFVAGRLGFRRPQPAGASSGRLTDLKAAKRRVSTPLERDQDLPAGVNVPTTPSSHPQSAPKASPSVKGSAKPERDKALASRLLDKRKQGDE